MAKKGSMLLVVLVFLVAAQTVSGRILDLVVTEGRVQVTRGGVPTILEAPPTQRIPLEEGDVIQALANPPKQEVDYTIQGATKVASCRIIEKPPQIHTKYTITEIRDQQATVTVTGLDGSPQGSFSIYVDPIPEFVVMTPKIGVDVVEGAYSVWYNAELDESGFVVLGGEISVYPFANSNARQALKVGETATYVGDELQSIELTDLPFPASPAELVSSYDEGADSVVLRWNEVVETIAGIPIYGVTYEIYRMATTCSAEAGDDLIGSTNTPFFEDFSPPSGDNYYRVLAVHLESGLMSTGSPQSEQHVPPRASVPASSLWSLAALGLVLAGALSLTVRRRLRGEGSRA